MTTTGEKPRRVASNAAPEATGVSRKMDLPIHTNVNRLEVGSSSGPSNIPTSMTTPDKPIVELLPNELLSTIFAYLDGPQPSASALLDEPNF